VRLSGLAPAAFLLVRPLDEQSLDLAQEIAGAERFDQQRLGMLPRPVIPVGGVGGEQGGGRFVALTASCADNLQTRLFGFHAQIADDHVVDAGLESGEGFRRVGGGLNFKAMEFEDGFKGQQNSQVVIDEQNAPFHVHPEGG
jgi:hypothetical protein